MARVSVEPITTLVLSKQEAFAVRIFLRDFLDSKGHPREGCEIGSFADAAWNVVEALEEADPDNQKEL